MAKKTSKPLEVEQDPSRELLIAAHLIKYNLYLLTKATIFSAVYNGNVKLAAKETEAALAQLDLEATKQKDLKDS